MFYDCRSNSRECVKSKVKNKDDQESMRKKLFGEGDIVIGLSLFTSSSDSGFPALLFRLPGGSLVALRISLI
jgi:hypothetical protein